MAAGHMSENALWPGSIAKNKEGLKYLQFHVDIDFGIIFNNHIYRLFV